MELVEAIRGRRSIRAFDDRPVDRAIVEQVVDAATYAPSRMNMQPWHFHIATGAARARIVEVMGMSTVHLTEYLEVLGPDIAERAARFYADLGNAPVVIGIAAPNSDDAHEAKDIAISVGAAIENMLLTATSLALGTCSIAVPHWISDQLAEVFAVAEGWSIVSIMVLGYPAEEPQPRARNTDVATYLT